MRRKLRVVKGDIPPRDLKSEQPSKSPLFMSTSGRIVENYVRNPYTERSSPEYAILRMISLPLVSNHNFLPTNWAVNASNSSFLDSPAYPNEIEFTEPGWCQSHILFSMQTPYRQDENVTWLDTEMRVEVPNFTHRFHNPVACSGTDTTISATWINYFAQGERMRISLSFSCDGPILGVMQLTPNNSLTIIRLPGSMR